MIGRVAIAFALFVAGAAHTALAGPGLTPGQWQPLGPSAGTVFALEEAPDDPHVLFAGTYLGGLYRSGDYGVHWTQVDTPFSSRMVLSIVFDPQSAATVYAGTFQGGIYRSGDGGQTWAASNTGLADLNVAALAADPSQAGALLAATGGGIYRSVDRGDSWRLVLAVDAHAMLFDPRTPGVALAGASGQLWRSVDGGEGWAAVGASLGVHVSTLIVDPQRAGGYLAATAGGVYRFDPSVAAWYSVAANLPPVPIYQIVPFPGSHVWFVVTDAGIFVNAGSAESPWWMPWATFDVEPRRLLFGSGGVITHVALRHGALKATLDFGQHWFAADAGMQNLFVGALATRQAGTDTVLYAGSDLGVHLTSPSFGSSLGTPNWFHAPVFDEGIFRLVPHPTQQNVLFAGTERAGVWKSRDWGVTWTPSSHGLVPREVFALAQSPVGPSTLYAGTSSGVFRSGDRGWTWRAVATRDLHPTEVTAVALDPGSPLVAWFGTSAGLVFRTLDGDNFFSVSAGLPNIPVQDLRITAQARFARLADGRLFWANGDGPWTAAELGAHVQAIALGPAASGDVFAGTLGYGLLRSHAGGAWLPSSAGLDVPFVFSIATDPTNAAVMYVGSYLPYRSLDGGASWTAISGNLPFGPITDIGVDQQNPATIYAAIQGHGIYRSRDRGGIWSLIRGGAADGPMLVDAVTGDVLVGEGFGGVLRSTDRGATWQSSAGGMSVFTRALTIDPADPNRMYAGSLHGGLFRSWDGGVTWTLIGLGDKWIQDVAVDPTNPQRLYVATTTGMSRSVDGGTTWTDVGPPTATPVGLFVLALAIDPSAPSTVYAATGGYGVWKSTDAGATWTQASYALTTPLVLTLVLDSSRPQTLYAGTAGGGVFVTDNGAASWQPLGQLSNGFVTSLSIDPVQAGLIYAGIEGGGVFGFLRP